MLVLYVYVLLVLFLAGIGPYLDADLSSFTNFSFAERAVYATKFLFLAETTWPAVVCVLLPTVVIFLVYWTHSPGPLVRFRQSARELEQGNFTHRIRLRKGDKLQDLAESLNGVFATVERAIAEVRDREALQRTVLSQCLEAIRAEASTNHDAMMQLERALKEGQHIEAVLNRFQTSSFQEQVPSPADKEASGQIGPAVAPAMR
ncbi:MAG: hypothetical protein V3S71_06710 [Acidobacteriota bacterium]